MRGTSLSIIFQLFNLIQIEVTSDRRLSNFDLMSCIQLHKSTKLNLASNILSQDCQPTTYAHHSRRYLQFTCLPITPMDQDINVTKIMVSAIYIRTMPPLVLPTKMYKHSAKLIPNFIECVSHSMVTH